ncbi:MAG: nicotinate-nucleotide--dimethylbenzimidazole phosphoribosyltransferase [Porticoccaceae bacterium]
MTEWIQNKVTPPCAESRRVGQERQNQLTKPQGSLGRLEGLAIDFAGFQKTPLPSLQHIAVRVFAADHGIARAGVSAFPQSVTAEMVRNFAAGGAAITVLAHLHHADFAVINLGTAEPMELLPNVINSSLGAGTHNFSEQAAMSPPQLESALRIGRDSCPANTQLFIGGEMGIGNTTSAAAIYSAMLDMPAELSVGRGTGIDHAGLIRKQRCIEKALALHVRADTGPQEILRCLGGFEIAALVGAYIGCAQRGIPSLVDGFICTAAALVACRLNPSVKPWLRFSHCSAEAAHRSVLRSLGALPLLDLGLRLGEGSGAAVAIPIIQAALTLHREMATFAEAGMSVA